MKAEKELMNSKLDEFSNILCQFQQNQRQFEYENQQLKQKLSMMENTRDLRSNTPKQMTINSTQSLAYQGRDGSPGIAFGN
jgi:hypothetical protein